jgi:DNA-binding response OmpR family regulator
VNIAVVEDDVSVCAALVGVLTHMGFRATPFLSADAAREGLGSVEPPDLVICDVNLGAGEDGFALAAWMRTHWPALPIVFASARPPRELPPNSLFLAKPFGLPALRDAIATLTGRSTSRCA